jgi:hypothetical protein
VITEAQQKELEMLSLEGWEFTYNGLWTARFQESIARGLTARGHFVRIGPFETVVELLSAAWRETKK